MFSFFINNIAVLNPKGLIAGEQKDLIIRVVSLMLIAVVPALVMTFLFAWKYRAGNNSKYTPNFDKNGLLQFAWLAVLCVVIIMLGTIAWKSSHALDPRKPIVSNTKPITIQVVALQWKWLFIYPEQNIATINYIQFPINTPINFEITADAPMNSFWIPQLGGQMYAMNGMKTSLHLQASEAGEYRGMSTNISGEGFAGMRFTAKASSAKDFNTWLVSVKKSSKLLSMAEYDMLAKPSKNNAQVTYASTEDNLFSNIIMKFTMPEHMH